MGWHMASRVKSASVVALAPMSLTGCFSSSVDWPPEKIAPHHPDVLVSVPASVAERATLSVDGEPGSEIRVSDHQSVDLEWRDGTGVIHHEHTFTCASCDTSSASLQAAGQR